MTKMILEAAWRGAWSVRGYKAIEGRFSKDWGSSWRGAVLPWTRRYISNISYILLFLVAQEAKLTIDPILTTDEGEYKCEITFLDVSKNCPVVQLVKLTTLAR